MFYEFGIKNFHKMLKINDLRHFLGTRMWSFCGKVVVSVALSAFLGSCGTENVEKRSLSELPSLEYSRNLRLGDLHGESVAEIRSIVGRDTLVRRFVLRNPGDEREIPRELSGSTILQVPLQRVAALSSSHIGYMLRLGLSDRIVGVCEGKYVVDSALYHRVKSGEVAEVGNGPSLQLERLVLLAPDLVLNFATGGEHDDYGRIAALGLPLMLTSEWQEENPLAKLEWIKLFGKLFGVESRADSVYEQGKNEYLEVARLSESVPESERPRVIVGASYGGIWYAPGGSSYTAQLVKAAGGRYLWASDTSRELRFSLEEIVQWSDSADVWVNPGMFSNSEDIVAAEPRMAYLKAFRDRRVCQNDGRKGPGGGNDFYESAVTFPAEVAKDLRECLNNATNTPVSRGRAFDWYHNIFIF